MVYAWQVGPLPSGPTLRLLVVSHGSTGLPEAVQKHSVRRAPAGRAGWYTKGSGLHGRCPAANRAGHGHSLAYRFQGMRKPVHHACILLPEKPLQPRNQHAPVLWTPMPRYQRRITCLMSTLFSPQPARLQALTTFAQMRVKITAKIAVTLPYSREVCTPVCGTNLWRFSQI